MTRRATPVSIASSSGQHEHAAPSVTAASRSRRSTATSKPSADAGLGGRVAASPARSAISRRHSRATSSGPLVAQQRQRDPLAAHVAEVDVREEQPLVEQRRARTPAPRSAR